MNINKSKRLLLAMGLIIGVSSFAPMIHATTDPKEETAEASVVAVSEVNKFLEEKREERAKLIIESVPESSPLTLESKEEIVEYYAETYIPKEGCSLMDLPADSDINYVPPKPKPKPKKEEPKVEELKVKSSKATSTPTPASTTPSKPTTPKTSEKPTTTSTPQKATSHNGKSISMSSEDRGWLEKIVEAEATGESYEGKVAVATVIANRVESSAFPNSVMGVIKANNGRFHQFSPWDDGRVYKMNPTSSTKQAVAAVFDNGERNLPKDTAYFAVKSIAFNNWMGKTRKHLTTIGNHAFFSEQAK